MAFASPRLGARITVTGAEAPTYQPPKAWMPSPRSGVGSPRMQLAPPASDSVDAPGRTWLSQKTVTNAMASGPSNYLRSRAVFNGVHNGVKMLSPREKSGAAGGQIVPPHQTDSKGAPMRGVTSFPYDPSQTVCERARTRTPRPPRHPLRGKMREQPKGRAAAPPALVGLARGPASPFAIYSAAWRRVAHSWPHPRAPFSSHPSLTLSPEICFAPWWQAYIENFAPIVASTLVHPYNAITESNADSIAFNIITGSACACAMPPCCPPPWAAPRTTHTLPRSFLRQTSTAQHVHP